MSSTRYGATTSEWIPKQEDSAAAVRANSSATTTVNRQSTTPAPPYSSGMFSPSKPCLPASIHRSRGKAWASMNSFQRGSTLRARNSRAWR